MSANIEELVEYLTNAKVTTIAAGISELNEFFKSFEFHPYKVEWKSMNKDCKKELVKSLLIKMEDKSSNSATKKLFEGGASNLVLSTLVADL